MQTIQASGRAAGFRFALVVSKYHDFITDRLQAGALEALTAAGVAASDITVVRVPGAFEIPLAAQHAAESGRFDAVVSLGCVIRGETPHFDYICSAVAHGLTSRAFIRLLTEWEQEEGDMQERLAILACPLILPRVGRRSRPGAEARN